MIEAMEIIQVAQRALDLERAVLFYERLLGMPVTARFDPPGLVFFQLPNTRLLIERGAPSSLIYLSVPDVREVCERLRAEGIRIVTPPHVIYHHPDDAIGPAGSDEWMGFIEDSEGNTLGLVSWLPSAGE